MSKEWVNKHRKTIVLLISVFAFIVIFVGFLYIQLLKYHDTHTWATIWISGTVEAETSDAFEQENECLKGDTISAGGVTLYIDRIEHDGTVTFHVKQGEMKDANGELVKKETLTAHDKKRYRLTNGSIQVEVISNRYE